jgi:branched-chain amino acid transport system permease protein
MRDLYTLHILVLALIWLVIVAAWDLITGYAGIFSFGQIAFFVIGAYVSGILSTTLAINPWLAMPAAALFTGLTGVAIGLPCLRVKGVYIAVVTYALHLVLPTAILRGEVYGTGGAGGLLGIPSLRIGGFAFGPLDKVRWYYAALVLATLCVYIIYFRIVKSNFGLALTALRDAGAFAASLGVNEHRTKLMVFALSGFFTGLAGAFYVHYTGSVSQKLLGMDLFLLIMVMLIVGGMGRYPGAVVGTFVFAVGNELLRMSGSFRLIILGAVIVVAMLVMPQGLMQLFEAAARVFSRASSGGRG